MTQRQQIERWFQHYLILIPAKMGGKVWGGKMFGSETSRMCRKMREEKKLSSHYNGKFEVFYLAKNANKFSQTTPGKPTVMINSAQNEFKKQSEKRSNNENLFGQ